MSSDSMEGIQQQGEGEEVPGLVPLSNVLNEEELSVIPDEVRLKINEWTNEVRNGVRSVINGKESEIIGLQAKIKTIEDEAGRTFQNLEETGERYRNTVTRLATVEEASITHQREAAEAQLKCDILSREKDEMVLVINKRNEEIAQLSETVKTMSDQLQAATVAKIDALVKVDELTGKEMELEYKEKQLEREKEWTSKQVQLLTDELDKKNSEIISVQREFSVKHLQLQTDLSEKNEQIRIAELSLANLKKANESQEKHIEHLIEKLRDSEDMEMKMQENFRQELSAQRKIAELYKESSEEAGKKVEELEDAVSSLQDLLKQATEKYGILENKFINTCKDYQAEVAKRDEEIGKIKKELDNANKLIESFQSKGLTDEMIQSLSPAAAAATNMLKNSKSITQIYSEYHDLCNEVIARKGETVKLNQTVRELLHELQTQGPELAKEKDRSQRQLERIEVLEGQLEIVVKECDRAKTETAQVSKVYEKIKRENERLRGQLSDLAKQVQSLLKETETQRGDRSQMQGRSQLSTSLVSDAEVPDIESGAQQVVSERLVTFKNIEELQMQNQRLLAVVRELTESQEKATREAHENQLQMIKDSFQEAMRELEVLREKRQVQDKVLQSAIQQRDALSELLKQQKSPVKTVDPHATAKLADLQKSFDSLQTSHKSLLEEYETYKKERSEHEKLAVEQTEKLRDDLLRLRTENAKLGSQVEYNNERTKIYNANLETYRKNISVLEERNKKYGATTLKLEQSLEMLKSEMSACQQKLARAEVALNSMTQERNQVRDTNARLQAERDLLKRNEDTQQMLRLNLQEIKNGLEMSNSALRMKLESQIENLQKENAILRRKVSAETERFKEAVFSWESANKELIEKLRNDQDSLQATKEALENSKANVARLEGEIEDLQNQVKILQNTTLETVNQSDDQPVTIPALERQIKELQSQLREAKIENETLTQHLSATRQSADEYRTLCATIEGQIAVITDTSKQLTEELQQRLEGKDEVIRSLQEKVDSSEKECAVLKDDKDKITRDLENKTVSLEEEINRMRRDLQAANAKLQSAYEESCRMKLDLEKQSLLYRDVQEKYEKELSAHGDNQNTMIELRNEVDNVRLRLQEEEQIRRNAENQLNQAVSDWLAKENALRIELASLGESKEELETLNSTLQNQIINMTTRMENASGSQGEEGGNNDNQKSSEQWLQLIRYLRREKEIAKTKTEMAEATCARYENQIKHLEKQIDDFKKELSQLQDQSHVSIITSAKQADLLKKVDTLSALTDSNRMLREEKDTALKELTDLRAKYQVVEVEIGPLREKSSELEQRCESLLNDNTALKQEVARWRARAGSLLEKSNKVNMEEMKRLQTDNENLLKQTQSLQEQAKRQMVQVQSLTQQLKVAQAQSTQFQNTNTALQNDRRVTMEELTKVREEKQRIQNELQTVRLELSSLKNAQVEKDQLVEKLTKDVENINKTLEEQRNTVKAVKNIARKYKKQYEDLLKGQGDASSSGVERSQLDAQMEADDSTKEELAQKEALVNQLQEELETLKRDAETQRQDRAQAEERLKAHLKTLREKLTVTAQQKQEFEVQLAESRAKVSALEVSNEENSSRFAALKSQFEGKIVRMEKEYKDLKAATSSGNGEINEVLQQQNEDQKKELDMLKQRLAALENRLKMQTQTSKVVSPEKVMPVEKAKANIKPIPGPAPKQMAVARPPLTARIGPISMPRKATVSVSAMPTQNSQASSSAVSAAVVAPVSQAQVSTSTPDQSSASAPESSPQQQMHQLQVPSGGQVRQAAAVQPTITVTPVAVGLPVGPQPGTSQSSSSQQNQSAAGGISGTISTQQSSSSSSGSGGAPGPSDTQVAHQDPSTSSGSLIMEESEMGDSSEQVSSSEGSTHQNILTVAPLRSKQVEAVQQSSTSSNLPHQQPQPGTSKNVSLIITEEPSPSSSSLQPSQSRGKRSRDPDEPHHHDEEEDLLNDREVKRAKVIGTSIDREAEALGQQESSSEHIIEEEMDGDEHEADQAPDEAQIRRGDTTTNEGRQGRRPTDDQDDSDSDVIVIESDDEDQGITSKATTSRESNQMAMEEEDDGEDLEEEEVEDEVEDEEDIIDDDDVDDDDDDQGDDDDDQGGKRPVEFEDVEGQEGREADSLGNAEDDMRLVRDGHDDSQDILDSNDSNINAVDFSGEDQGGQHHELREAVAEQSIDDDGDEDRGIMNDMAPEPTMVVPIPAQGSPVRPTRPQSMSSPMRGSQRGGIPPLMRNPMTPSFSGHQYHDDADDSIVPGTPTLYVPRRSDGFAEAVSSPQIQPGGRFNFSQVSGDSSGSQAGTSASSSSVQIVDDTRVVDFLGYDEAGSGTTGRSVPSTPLQVSPPVEGVELSAEMQADEDAAQEEGMASLIVDVQPTSSSIVSVSGSDVPAITVTSGMDSYPPMEGTSTNSLEAARLAAMSSQPRTSTHSEVSNVTSSDEDKVPIAGTSSSIQHPSTSTSSRAVSPTPSSNPPTEQKDPVPQPQQQQQGGRTRPIPIVWDQPSSSSSSSNPTSRPIRAQMGRGVGAMSVRHMIQPDQGHLMAPIIRGFRPVMASRGQNQSARRSRPHHRGGPAGGPGLGGPPPGPGGSLGGRMPFQKPY